MPIVSKIPIRNVSQAEFNDVDRLVMGCAFDSQNALGRLCNEKVYENDLARRLKAGGAGNVHTQVSVKAIHGSFEKEYLLDLVVDDVLYELKTVKEFSSAHDAQVLNYAIMLGVNRGKLINFRPARVQGRLRYNAVSEEDRRELQFDEAGWKPLAHNCEALIRQTKEFLADWGAYLDFRLYEEGLVHHFGGEPHATGRFPLTCDGAELGDHPFNFHAPGVAFAVSGFANPVDQTSHFRKLLTVSPFDALQWINIHHSQIRFETLQNCSPVI